MTALSLFPPSRLPDAVVVGGGSAGAVIAARLARSGADVVLLEAGSDPGPAGSPAWPADLVDANRCGVTHDWGYAGTVTTGRVLPFARARVLGGCSAHNGCTQAIGWRGDYDADAPYLPAEAVAAALPGVVAALRIRQPERGGLTPFQAAFLDATAATGVPHRDDLLDLDGGRAVAVGSVNEVDGIRWNAAFGYLDPLRGSAQLEIIGDALVDRVETVSGRVQAVHAFVGARRVVVPCRLVVLSAGAYGTPEILLRSGIGPAAGFAALGIRPALDLPAVGRGLQDQPVLERSFDAGDELARALDEAEAGGRVVPDEGVVAKLASGLDPEGAPYDLHVFPWTERDPASATGWTVSLPVGLLRPESTGAVTLRSSDPSVRAALDHAYLAEDRDCDRLLAGADEAEEIRRGIDLGREQTDGAPPAGADAERRAWIRARHVHYWHPCGSARAGDDGVLDADYGVRGVSGLYVADASALPSVPRATTALPTTLLAEHAAARLIARA